MADKRTMSVNFAASSAEFAKGVEGVKASLTELNAKYEENKTHLKSAEDALKELVKEHTKASNALKEMPSQGVYKSAYEEQSKIVDELAKKINEAQFAIADFKAEEQLLKPQIDAANKTLKEQYNAFNNLEKSSKENVGGTSKLNTEMRSLISTLKTGNINISSLSRTASGMGSSISALTIGIGLWITVLKKFNEEYERQKQQALENIRIRQEEKAIIAESAKAAMQKADSSRHEYESLKNLTDEYEKIGIKTNYTSEEKEKLIQILYLSIKKYKKYKNKFVVPVNKKIKTNEKIIFFWFFS
ncbi:MAG: hypothetical protein FWG44_06950, partial [Oscillospiraceae bacterium]|nr:hypothetical protein [Oscillospiraceae bacterium]